jgi:ADP-heptose:LPS heptosyltransferase
MKVKNLITELQKFDPDIDVDIITRDDVKGSTPIFSKIDYVVPVSIGLEQTRLRIYCTKM